MKPVSASPALRDARALGRAFRGAGRALRRGLTWFLIVAFGVCLPWLAMLGRESFENTGPPDPIRALGTVSGSTLHAAFHAASTVLLLALLVPLLEGRRVIDLRQVRSAAAGLAVAAAALAGADIAMQFLWHRGWIQPLGLTVLGTDLIPEYAMSLVFAWVGARVLSALRGRGAWPWSGMHLLDAGALLLAGSIATWAAAGMGTDWPEWMERFLEHGWEDLPPVWWVVWRLGDALFALVALEYLRIEPPPAPAEVTP